MSGSQIGSAVGFVAGFFLPGGPAVWSTIGGAIGGWISPTQVNGPRIGDGAAQSSAEGQPIAWVIGTCGWLQGNIVDKSPRREVKKTDDGKGSGQEVNTFEAHQDFVIMICESSEHRESLMTGVLIAKVDGKIVYDMRPDKNFGAENAKFLKNHTFYDGNESQMPDPTEEAFPHNGVGNTPYYRGVFRCTARDVNLTQYGDRIPLYEWVMVGAGESSSETVDSLVVPELSRFVDAEWPLADDVEAYDFLGYIGFSDGTGTTYAGDTPQEIIDYFTNYDYSTHGGGSRAPVNYLGYSASTAASTSGSIGLSIDDYGVSNAATQPSVVDNESLVLVYNDVVPTGVHGTIGFTGFCGIGPDDAEQDYRGAVGTIMPATPGGQYGLFESCGDPNLYGTYPLCIVAVRKPAPFVAQLGDPCLLGEPTILPDAPGYVMDCAGNVTPTPTYAEISGTFLRLQNAVVSTASGRSEYTQYAQGPVMLGTDPNNTEAYWEAAYDASVVAGESPPGQTYPDDYPVTVSEAYEASYESTAITTDTVGLDTAITRICKRGGLTVDDIDVSEMDQQLLGYMITQAYNGADCIRPLMTAFTSYGSEYDAKLRFHKHGEEIEIVVNPDDFIVGSDETDKNTREQEIEYPRLLSVTAIDPTQDYTARPQVERRITPDIRAIGEEQMQVPIVMAPDSQRQLASIGMKVSWARAQGKREFSVPYATSTGLYLYLVAGKPFALDGKRYVAQNVRLEDGEIHFEAVYDRQSAYTSDVTATPALAPTAPASNIGGVTLFAAMNLPRLRSKDNSPGMYIAVDGLLDSWPGCALQMSIDDEATWTTAIGSMTQSSVMGYLTAPIDDQPTSTLSVSVHGGDLNTITDTALANGGNASAIITDEVSEVLQFQTSDETDPDEYELSDLVRGGLGTTSAAHVQGDRFVELSSVYFLPLDISLAGRVIKFRPVTFGTPPERNAVYSVTFHPLFTGPQISTPLTVGGENLTVDGAPIFVVTYA